MTTSINFKSASHYGLCRDTDGSVVMTAPTYNRSFFIAKLRVRLVPIPARQNGSLRDYPKVKHPDRVFQTTSAMPIKRPYDASFRPQGCYTVAGFVSYLKRQAERVGLTIQGGLIKRRRFL